MSGTEFKRRLAAILAADVAGYSRLMAADERATVSSLDAARAVFRTQIESNQGRVIDMAGDSVLAVFETATGAVSAGLGIQQELKALMVDVPDDRRMRYRIGVHLGDVIEKADGTIYGDGVNIAARLEGLAEPGGITISDSVRIAVRGKVVASFEDQGEQQVKNIPHPVRAFAVRTDVGAATPSPSAVKIDLSLPDKPSIAVLPFTNMSADPEQEYFADGIVEDIITALSRMRWLFVIARNSSFTYKGRAVDVKQVGRELGVRYVLEGSVRKVANRVRITGQLINASTGMHLWADRFDGGLEDIFDLQDHVTTSVLGAIAPKLEQAEIVRSKRKTTESLDAYDYYLRGLASIHAVFGGTKEAVSEALRLFYVAIERDPDFASAYGMAAWCYVLRKNYGWMTDDAQEIAEVERLARQAARLAKEDAVALYTGGFALAQIVGNLDAGAALIDRALALDPNLAAAWHLSGWVRIYLGEPEMAIEHMARAMRLNPLDPLIFGMQNGTAAAHFLAGRYNEASSWAEKALGEHSNYLPAIRMAAASHALARRLAEAQKAMARMRQIDPELRGSNLTDLAPFRGPKDVARYVEGLERAGLPE